MKKVCFLIFLSMLLIGCQAGSYFIKPTPTFYLSSEQGLTESLVIFSDDFSKTGSGWGITNNSLGSRIAYEHQGLRIYVNEQNTDFWSTILKSSADARIAVDASKLGGPDDNYYGIICRMQDSLNYYAFLISSDGYYGISKVENGIIKTLSGQNMDFSPIINRSRGTNRVRGDCIGTSLTMYVNGQELISVNDDAFAEGRYGIIAGSNAQIGVDILFDNFFVYQPQ